MKDFPLLDRDVKYALNALARPGAHGQTSEMNDVAIYSGLYDVVQHDPND